MRKAISALVKEFGPLQDTEGKTHWSRLRAGVASDTE